MSIGLTEIKPKDFSNYLFRPSSLAKLLGGYFQKWESPLTAKQETELKDLQSKDSKSKKRFELKNKLVEYDKLIDDHRAGMPVLTDATKHALLDIFNEEVLGITNFEGNTATYRGTDQEKDSLQLLNDVTGGNYAIFGKRLENGLISGQPDIVGSTMVGDIKTCLNYPTFLKKGKVEADKYKWQLWGYYNLLKTTQDQTGLTDDQINKIKGGCIIFACPSYPDHYIQAQVTRFTDYLNKDFDFELADEKEIETHQERIADVFKTKWLNLNYDRIPKIKRIKIAMVDIPKITYADAAIYLESCRKYLQGINNNYFTKETEIKIIK